VGRILYFELSDGERLGCPVEEALQSRAIRRKYGGYTPRLGRAMVQLTVDPQSRLDVRIPRTGARGILRGTGWDRSYSTRIQYVGASPLITAGDLVVTSGVDGRFPPGLPVGRVIAVKDQPGQEPLVTVRPAVDFGKLKRVLVVLSPPPPESAARPRKPPDRLGLVPYP
jgi:cell shape-determining protein MreC